MIGIICRMVSKFHMLYQMSGSNILTGVDGKYNKDNTDHIAYYVFANTTREELVKQSH